MIRDRATPNVITIDEARATLRTVRDRGVRWLLDHIASDGNPVCSEERNGYYRVPWTLAFVGQREAASEVMSWIEREAMTRDGDLAPGLRASRGSKHARPTRSRSLPRAPGRWSATTRHPP